MEALLSAGIYLRISLDAKNDELGVTRQDTDCTKRAVDRQWNVIDRYTDNDESAKKSGTRKDFKRLLEDIEAGLVKVVIAWNFDRLLRNDRDKLALMEAGQKHGIIISLIRGPELDLSTATGRMMAGVLAEMARWEIELKSERHRSANLQKFSAGKPHASRRPFGYELGYTAIRQDEAKLYREMARQFLAGYSCKSIAYWLNENGYVTTQGKKFYPITVRNLLLSPRYIAVREYQRVQYPGVWEPLIDRPTWDRVQLLMQARQLAEPVSLNARKYLLTGKLICGRCGNRLTGTARQDRPTAPKRRIYTCKLQGDTKRHAGCSLRINAEALDYFVKEACISRLDSPELAELLNAQADHDDNLQALLAERQAQSLHRDGLVDDYAKRLLTRHDFARAVQTADAELQRIDAEIGRFTRSTTAVGILGAGDQVREAFETKGKEFIRQVVDLLIVEIVIMPDSSKPFYEVNGVRMRFAPRRVRITWADSLDAVAEDEQDDQASHQESNEAGEE